tara:strand:- start:322 stop:4809 length:4488 start_codon:yes stop_codon:yes gene_type:complete
MASTIQTIETPKRARALDTSTGWQIVSAELIASNAANNRTFDSGVGDWIVYDGDHPDDTAIANASNKLQVTTTVDDADEGAQLPIAHVGDGSTTSIVAGRSYRVSMDLDLTTPGSGTFAMRMTFAGDTSSSFDITTTETTYTKDFVAQNNTGGLFIYNTSSTNTVFTVDNVSVKEIRNFPNNNHGQIYSGRGLEFDGVTDYLDTPIKFDSTNFTFAAWIKANDDSVNKVIIDCRDGDNDGIMLQCTTAETIKLGLNAVDTTGSAIVANKWARVVATYDGSTVNIYVNGVLDVTASVSQTFSADTKTLRIGRKAYGDSNYFNGLMSDVQVWTTAWTADDASYDYLNPESIVLNRGGTSLTNSNLKLWYPMQGGHRGQQSYILDASNTGLGDNMLTDRDGNYYADMEGLTSNSTDATGYDTIDNAAGYEVFKAYGTTTVVSLSSDIKYSGSSSLKFVTDATDTNAGVYTAYTNNSDRILGIKTGTTYKVSGYIYRESGSGAIDVFVKKADGGGGGSANWGMTAHRITPSSNGVWEYWENYYTSAESGDLAFILFSNSQSVDTYYLDNIKFEPVNDKNHATTLFYGDDMWDAADNSTSIWTVSSNSSSAVIDGTNEGVKLVFGNATSPHGSFSQLRETKGLNSDLTIGRQYRVTGLFATDVAGHYDTGNSINNGAAVSVYNGSHVWPNEASGYRNVTATNLVANGTMEANDNWNAYGSGTISQSTVQKHNGSNSFKFVVANGGENDGIQSDTFTVTAGTTYLLSAWIYPDDTTTITMKVLQGDGSTLSESITGLTENAWNHVVRQFTNATAGSSAAVRFTNTGTNSSGTDDNYYIDDVVYTAFLERNIDFTATDATTNYIAHHSTEMSTANSMIALINDRNAIFDEAGQWVEYVENATNPTNPAITDPGERLQFYGTSSTDKEGVKLLVANFEALELGRSYVVQVNLEAGAGTPTVYVGLGGAESTAGQAISTTATDYAFNITPINTTGSLLVYTKEDYTGGSNHIFMDNIRLYPTANLYVDDLSVKEIGVASGWTDADQQLHIPQTVLQSYNELLWFPGNDALAHATNDYDVSISAHSDLANIFDTGGSVSVWVFCNGAGAGTFGRIIEKDSCWELYTHNESNEQVQLTFQLLTSSTNSITRTDGRLLNMGQWNHIVVTYNSSTVGTAAKIYINGEEVDPDHAQTGSGTRTDDTTKVLTIGNKKDGTRTFDGTITEVSLWTNTLTHTEVNELYNDGKALDVMTSSSYLANNGHVKGYWRNNGLNTWTDLSDNSNNGTVNNITETMLIPQGVDGSRDSQGFIMNRQRNISSLNFPAVTSSPITLNEGSYVEIQDNPTLNFGTGVFSIEGWAKAKYRAKPNAAGTASTLNTIFHLGDGISDSDTSGICSVSTIKLGFYVGGQLCHANATFTEGNWYHIVGVREGTGTDEIKLYIDGVLQSDTETYAGSITNTHNPGISFDSNSTRRYEEAIDGIKVYNKALSLAEVKRNYNATKSSHRN